MYCAFWNACVPLCVAYNHHPSWSCWNAFFPIRRWLWFWPWPGMVNIQDAMDAEIMTSLGRFAAARWSGQCHATQVCWRTKSPVHWHHQVPETTSWVRIIVALWVGWEPGVPVPQRFPFSMRLQMQQQSNSIHVCREWTPQVFAVRRDLPILAWESWPCSKSFWNNEVSLKMPKHVARRYLPLDAYADGLLPFAA